VLLPAGFDPEEAHTLIVALHGIGSSARAFGIVGAPIAAQGYIVALPEAAYPVLNDDGQLGFDWWLGYLPDLAMHARAMEPLVLDHLPAVVNDLRQRYRIDRVYPLGFSQGALTAYIAGIYNGDLFDGIIAFGGRIDAAWFQGDTLAAGREVRVLILHGREDKAIRFAEAEHARDLLTANGYDVTFRPFGGGHVVPPDQLGFVMDWIEALASEGEE
jgi:phospholipase/carboxylesterase